jgi:hypothetical protein
MPDLDTVHDRLRDLLRAHADGFHVAADSSAGMTLELPGYEGSRGATSPAPGSASATSRITS